MPLAREGFDKGMIHVRRVLTCVWPPGAGVNSPGKQVAAGRPPQVNQVRHATLFF